MSDKKKDGSASFYQTLRKKCEHARGDWGRFEA